MTDERDDDVEGEAGADAERERGATPADEPGEDVVAVGKGEFMADPPLVDGADEGDEIGHAGTRSALSVDYAAVKLPQGDYHDASVEQRRAVILHRIEQAGHPRALDQTLADLADEFDVHKTQIHRDKRILSEWCAENVERDHVAIMDAVFRGAVLDLVRDGKKARAAEIGRKWFEWLADMGAIERVPRNVNLDHTLRQASDETDEYVIIEDDEADAVQAEDGAAKGREPPDGDDVEDGDIQQGESEQVGEQDVDADTNSS